MITPVRPNHSNPLWRRIFTDAIQGFVIAGGRALGPPPEVAAADDGDSTALAVTDAAGSSRELVAGGASPVPDFHDDDAQEYDLTVHDLIVEEAALVADAAMRLLKRREELESSGRPQRAARVRDVHTNDRRPVGNIGKVPIYGTQPK
jgi:hypothetical protein